MSFDLAGLRAAVAAQGCVARVVLAAVDGSAPREVGAAMLVWDGGQSGTIGGGALEFEAARRARQRLGSGDWLQRVPLGPALGQCCGGAVTLLTEIYDARRTNALESTVILRRVEGQRVIPLGIKKSCKDARSSGSPIKPRFIQGWMIESVCRRTRPVWIYGAGHVGRALVAVFQPLPDFALTWIDTDADRFPTADPQAVTRLVAARPADVVHYAPSNAEHLVLTYSHAMDLELCHQLLQHGFRFAGLIGSRSKWARFRSRLLQLGHSAAQIDRICCPIGRPELGKHPQAIAVGVAAALLSRAGIEESVKDRVG